MSINCEIACEAMSAFSGMEVARCLVWKLHGESERVEILFDLEYCKCSSSMTYVDQITAIFTAKFVNVQ